MMVGWAKNVATGAKIALLGETLFEVGPLVVKPAANPEWRPEI